MNILFVDDERIIREGMCKIIDWDKVHCTKLVIAENADRALLELDKDKFDLIITDIRMQKMSGIEFAKIVKNRFPGIKTIILSAHENFSYARDAIEAGVIKYLLKPVKPVELEDAILEAMKMIDQQNVFNEQINEAKIAANLYQPLLAKEFWKSLIRKEIQDTLYIEKRMQLSGIVLPKSTYGCILFQTKQCGFEIRENMMKDIHEIASGCFFNLIDSVRMDRHNIVLVIYDEVSQSSIEKFVQMMYEFFHEYGKAIAGIMVTQIADLYLSYEDAEQLLRIMEMASFFLKEKNLVLSVSDSEKRKIDSLIKKIIDDTLYGKEPNHTLIAEFLDNVSQNNEEHNWSIYEVKLIFSFSQNPELKLLDKELDFNLLFNDYLQSKSKKEKEVYLSSLIQRLIYLRSNDRMSNLDELVKNAKRIVNQQMNDADLTMSSIAENLHVSTSHLSRTFRKKTGLTCIEYLSNIRIIEAERLLVSTEMKVQDISYLVGYSNVYYFSSQFKKIVGTSPSEYRKNVKNAAPGDN